MIAITGAGGFIGSNLVRGLNSREIEEVLVVDDLSDGAKFRNLNGCGFVDYLDKDEFRARLAGNDASLRKLQALFHQGACSNTMEQDGRFMVENNYAYSKDLLHFCLANRIPFIYASSAAVYGHGKCFIESSEYEIPANVYGFSKKLFDNYVRRHIAGADSQIAGLRYFNVYGPGEQHKGVMASVAYQFNQQVKRDGRLRLFRGSGGYGDGEQKRDFIYIADVVEVNLWFLSHRRASGIFNVGTGHSRSFNDLARSIMAWHKGGDIEYIEFPSRLLDAYQSFTEADLTALRGAGYGENFVCLEEGIRRYLDWLNDETGKV